MIRRCSSLNDSPLFIQVFPSPVLSWSSHCCFQAMADIVQKHLQGQRRHSNQLPLRCPGCTNASCEQMRSFFCAQKWDRWVLFIWEQEKSICMKYIWLKWNDDLFLMNKKSRDSSCSWLVDKTLRCSYRSTRRVSVGRWHSLPCHSDPSSIRGDGQWHRHTYCWVSSLKSDREDHRRVVWRFSQAWDWRLLRVCVQPEVSWRWFSCTEMTQTMSIDTGFAENRDTYIIEDLFTFRVQFGRPDRTRARCYSDRSAKTRTL